MDTKSIVQTLITMVSNREKAPATTLEPLYAELEPATSEFMIGQWKGGNFRDSTVVSNFYGKRFTSAEDCEPLLRLDESGTVYAWKGWGDARLRDVLFAGKVQAAVIYDDRPLIDYFRKVTDDIVIGMADLKGREQANYFWLTRDTDSALSPTE